MASGKPASRSQIGRMVDEGVGAEMEVGAAQVGERVREQGDAGFDIQRRDRIAALSGDAQELAARRRGGAGTARARTSRATMSAAAGEQLFEVVQEQQDGPDAEVERGGPGRAPGRANGGAPSVARKRGLDEARIGDRGEVDEPRAVREPRAWSSRPRPPAQGGSCRCRRDR